MVKDIQPLYQTHLECLDSHIECVVHRVHVVVDGHVVGGEEHVQQLVVCHKATQNLQRQQALPRHPTPTQHSKAQHIQNAVCNE